MTDEEAASPVIILPKRFSIWNICDEPVFLEKAVDNKGWECYSYTKMLALQRYEC